MFLLQDPVETVAIDRVIGRFVVYKDATFILIFIEHRCRRIIFSSTGTESAGSAGKNHFLP